MITDWQRQIKNRHMGPANFDKESKLRPFCVTPYYYDLLTSLGRDHPLWKTVLPTEKELEISEFEDLDPLSEERDSPVEGIVHRYPDRVLFIATNKCASFCRYCTRARIQKDCGADVSYLSGAINYIRSNKNIRDVIISGGDPLTLSTDNLEWIIRQLRNIDHVEIIRIGTKAPVVLPQRITENLINMLKKYHPIYVNIHFTHPDELTEEVNQACAWLADAGIPLGSQTVLLKGVNDSVETLKRLFLGLLKIRVKPYYLFQCDPVQGTAHFRTPVEKGLEIMRGLQGYISGMAVPKFVIDAPGGGGKVPFFPGNYFGSNGNVSMINYKGEIYSYPG